VAAIEDHGGGGVFVGGGHVNVDLGVDCVGDVELNDDLDIA
jgi:hypothetical protein